MLSFLTANHGFPTAQAVTPLRVDRFATELRSHPDTDRVAYVLDGLKFGFRIGFRETSLKSAKRNKPTASANPLVIDQYLANETRLGRVAGPFDTPMLQNLHISSFGVIPKKGQPGKWRLIVDLSSPHRFSVNDGIDALDFPLQYVQVDQIVQMVCQLGVGALMAKFDVEAAYRNIPVHPADRHLLGMKWKGQYFIDLVLPFGLRSAPFIFDSVASIVEWILINNYGVTNLVHYLDDFIMAGPPNSDICLTQLNKSVKLCTHLGLPLHPAKCLGPSTVMVVLGIELDSANQTARLPYDKFIELQNLIISWRSKSWCFLKELQSLVGHLQHAAKVVWPGRTFVRRILNLLSCFRHGDHHIRINVEFRRDLDWWYTFLQSWNGVSFWLYPGVPVISNVIVATDASGSIGYGAIYKQQWFNGWWVPAHISQSIAFKELFPIVLAAHVWGHQWRRKHVMFKCDNEAVVFTLNKRTSKTPPIMQLVRHLLFEAARHNFSFSSEHLPGKTNHIADALSRFHWQAFRHLAPTAHSQPTPIPPALLTVLTSIN